MDIMNIIEIINSPKIGFLSIWGVFVLKTSKNEIVKALRLMELYHNDKLKENGN
jgi:hypothetical protein